MRKAFFRMVLFALGGSTIVVPSLAGGTRGPRQGVEPPSANRTIRKKALRMSGLLWNT